MSEHNERYGWGGELDPRLLEANEQEVNYVMASYLDEARLRKGQIVEGRFEIEDKEARARHAAYALIERDDKGVYTVSVLRDTDNPAKDEQSVKVNAYKIRSDELGTDVRSVTTFISSDKSDESFNGVREALDSKEGYVLNQLTYDDMDAVISALRGLRLTESGAPDLPQQAWREAAIRSGKDHTYA